MSGLAKLFRQIKHDDWLGAAIEMQTGEPERWEEPRLTIHPSGAGSACLRNVQIAMLGHRTGFTPHSLRRMRNGTKAGERWDVELRGLGLVVESELRLGNDDQDWSGRMDFLVRHPMTGRLYVVELKTMNQFRFKRFPAQLEDRVAMTGLLERYERGYTYQLLQYVDEGMKQLGAEPEGIFLIENTDTQDYVVRYIMSTPEFVRRSYDIQRQGQAAARAGVLVPPPFKRMSKTCRSCYREAVCYRLQDGEATATVAVERALAIARVESGTFDDLEL